MIPIVDGIQARYGEAIAILRLNAADGAAGQQAFELSGLPGHPGYLLLHPDGTEAWRSFGEQPASALETEILNILAGP